MTKEPQPQELSKARNMSMIRDNELFATILDACPKAAKKHKNLIKDAYEAKKKADEALLKQPTEQKNPKTKKEHLNSIKSLSTAASNPVNVGTLQYRYKAHENDYKTLFGSDAELFSVTKINQPQN